jgi:hypothetical protein
LTISVFVPKSYIDESSIEMTVRQYGKTKAAEWVSRLTPEEADLLSFPRPQEREFPGAPPSVVLRNETNQRLMAVKRAIPKVL